MYDTHVTIVGNVLHEPQWRRTTNTGVLVTTFKIASTSRRLNKDTGQWVDGNSLRVRVNCWRSLASNVKNSVTRGDPLIVTGRLFTRDWEDENGIKRTLYELDAAAVGHDLSRGRAVFERVKGNTSTSTIEDEQAQQRVGGELTEPVPDEEAPAQFDDTSYDAALARPGPEDQPFTSGDLTLPSPVGQDEPVPFDPVSADPGGGDGEGGNGEGSDGEGGDGPSGDEPGSGRRRGLRRTKVPA